MACCLYFDGFDNEEIITNSERNYNLAGGCHNVVAVVKMLIMVEITSPIFTLFPYVQATKM